MPCCTRPPARGVKGIEPLLGSADSHSDTPSQLFCAELAWVQRKPARRAHNRTDSSWKDCGPVGRSLIALVGKRHQTLAPPALTSETSRNHMVADMDAVVSPAPVPAVGQASGGPESAKYLSARPEAGIKSMWWVPCRWQVRANINGTQAVPFTTPYSP